MVVLPWELTIEILLRLPVRSLVRFKSVCKSWLCLISDPHFAKSHFEGGAARTERLLLIAPSNPEIRSIDLNASLHDDAALKVKFRFPIPCYVRILGSCRGFLLLICDRSLCVWNPSTGVHKNVYWSPRVLGYFTFLRGFGYDPSTDDYLVVLMSYNPHSHDHVTRAVFFSLRANVWKEIEATHLSYKNCVFKMDNGEAGGAGSLLNGAIHWLAFNCDVSMDVILAFNVTERTFSEVPLPADFEYDNFRFCRLGVLGELISLSGVGWQWHHPAEIWVMKEYKVQSSWTKTIVVSVDHILTPTLHFFPICSTKSGDIVGTDNYATLAKCNDQGQLLEHRSYCNDPYGFQMAMYTESLLSLS